MLALKIIAIVVLILLLIMLIPVGVDFEYIGGEIKLSALICGLKLKIIPKREDSKKKAKEKSSKIEQEDTPKKENTLKKDRKPFKLCLSADEITEIFRKLLKGLGRLNFRPKRFLLHWIARGSNPYDTAVTFAKVNAVLSAIAPIFIDKFRTCNSDVWTDIDFSEEKMQLDAALAVDIRIGCFFRMINTVLFGVIGIFIKNRCRLLWLKLSDRDYYDYLMEKQGIAGKILAKVKAKKAA